MGMVMKISRYRTLKTVSERLATCARELLLVYGNEGMAMQHVSLADLCARTAKDFAEATVEGGKAAPAASSPVAPSPVEAQVDAMVAQAVAAVSEVTPVSGGVSL